MSFNKNIVEISIHEKMTTTSTRVIEIDTFTISGDGRNTC
jgi:hypothetical protein